MSSMIRRPWRSPSRPPATSTRPKLSAYPDTTHCTVCGDVSSPACIDGIATLTMVTSSRAMKPTTRVTPRIRQRCGCGAACCRPASASVEVTPRGYPTPTGAVASRLLIE